MRSTEHSPHVWARLRLDVNCALRRGAWYRVVRLTRDKVILDVASERVPVARSERVPVARRLVQTVFQEPKRWTVVPLPRDATNVPAEWGTRYAVCPACQARAPIADFPFELTCPQCRGLFAIAWDEHYLK